MKKDANSLRENDLEITLLSEGQIWGNEKESQLEVMKKYGTKAAITDLCVLTGSYLCEYTYLNIDEDSSLKGRTSWFWTRSDDNDNDVRMVYKDGCRRNLCRYERYGAVRPALQSSVIFSQIYKNRVRGYNGTEEVEYGEYPQYAADLRMQSILESEYNRGMNKTGGSYTFDSVKYDDYDTGFKPVTYEEYEYQGKKYIRIRANSDFGVYKFELSNGVEYRDGDYVWVEVSPVKWLLDKKTKILVSKRGLVSGIRFLDRNHNYKGDFKSTEMYQYLNTCFKKDIISSKDITTNRDTRLQKEKTISPMAANLHALKEEIEKLVKLLPEDSKIQIKNEYNNIIDEFDSNQPNPMETNISLNLSLNTYSIYSLYNRLLVLKNKLISQEELLTFLQEIYSYEKYIEWNKGFIREFHEFKSIEDILSNIISLVSSYKLSNEQDNVIYNQLNNFFEDIKNQKAKEINNLIDNKIFLTLAPVTFFKDKLRGDLLNYYNNLKITLEFLGNSLIVLKSLREDNENPKEIKNIDDNIKSLKYIVSQSNLVEIKEEFADIIKKYQELYQTFIEETLKTNKPNQEKENNLEIRLRKELLNFIIQNKENMTLEENKIKYKKMLEEAKIYIDNVNYKYKKLNIYLSYVTEILESARDLDYSYSLIIDSLKSNLDKALFFIDLAKTNNELNNVLKDLEDKLLTTILINIPNLKNSEIEATIIRSLK